MGFQKYLFILSCDFHLFLVQWTNCTKAHALLKCFHTTVDLTPQWRSQTAECVFSWQRLQVQIKNVIFFKSFNTSVFSLSELLGAAKRVNVNIQDADGWDRRLHLFPPVIIIPFFTDVHFRDRNNQWNYTNDHIVVKQNRSFKLGMHWDVI